MTGPFATFYASPWQHPVALWIAAAVGLGVALARRDVHRSVRRWSVGLAALAAIDAWLTTTRVPGLGVLTPPWASVVPLTFVIAGDLRYLALRAFVQPDGRIVPRATVALGAVALALVVPVASQLVVWALGSTTPRVLFLVYEVGFVLLVLALRRRSEPAAQRWARALDRVVLAWYGTWILADVLILGAGLDLGFAVRAVANLLYYGALPPVLARAAPAHAAA